jgi:endo-1,3-1,4-beta-glycanase ExoK
MATINRTITLLLAAGAGAGVFAQGITCIGAELYSKPNQGVKYGRWEIRMKTAATPGSVSSFFTYYDSSWMGKPQPWREIDIEVLGNKPNAFQSNIISGMVDPGLPNPNDGKLTSEDHHSVSGMSSGFHTFALDWTPDSIVWRINGKNVRKDDASNPQVAELRDKKQSYRMNLWSSTEPAWVGRLDLSKLPIYQVVNWMRFSAYTPGAGPNGSNFTESWIDDFNSFNTTRWAKGDWTFEGNQAQFSAVNVGVKSGYLILALTRPEADGLPTEFPKDPAGDTYAASTSVQDVRRGQPLLVRSTEKGIRIEGVKADGEIAVLDAHGRILSRAASSVSEIPLDARGVLFVRAGEQSATLVR